MDIIKREVEEVRQNKYFSLPMKIMWFFTVAIAIFLSIMSIPVRALIMLGGWIANSFMFLCLMGALLGFFFTPHIDLFTLLYIMFWVGLVAVAPSLIITLIEHIIKFLITWPIIFEKSR